LRPELECASCLLTWLIERIAVSDRGSDCYQAVRSVSGMIRNGFYPAANLGLLANRSIELAGELIAASAEHFDKIKSGNNQVARQTLPFAKNFIESGKTDFDVFERTCAVATAGNVSPIGLPSGDTRFEELENILTERSPLPAFQGDVHGAVQRASHILYIADNSGEIGFDSLLLSKLREMGKKITLVAKKGPFFEDATRKDISFFGLERVVDRVFTIGGFFVPNEIPLPVQEAFEKSDLVICKGTGNYEGLADETNGKETIFMLKIKCAVIARRMDMDIGSFVVKLSAE
jgi:uncharacterized protein with ATP-grasp and redox domains